MAFDLGVFVEEIGDKVANIKGYDSLEDLAVGGAAKNIARVTANANTTKQTPPVVQPTPYAVQFMTEQGMLGMSKGQMLLLGGIGLVALVLLLRR